MTRGGLSRFVWDGYERGEVWYEGCPVCGKAHSYPRGFCTDCGNTEMRWRRSAGLGTVYSAATVLRAPSPAFRALAPYDLYLLNLAEGPRLMAHGEEGLSIGGEARVDFEELDGVAIPFLRASPA